METIEFIKHKIEETSGGYIINSFLIYSIHPAKNKNRNGGDPAEWLERLTVNVEVATSPEFDPSLLPTQWNLRDGR